MTQQDFFSRYTFNIRTDKIGGGSFGSVYKAYDNTHHETVAIKVAEVQTINGKEFSLKSELKTAKSIPDHPNVALYKKVYQFEMPNGIFDYAVMKYYPAGNLKQVLQEIKLSEQQKINIVEQLINGVKHLHSSSILHRDLKPANILVHKNGDQYIPIIADFGISKLTQTEGSRITNSFGGGTLEYSAPEQLLGQPLRYNADLWSLGVIIYEIFTGKKLFRASSVDTSAEAQRHEIYNNIIKAPLPSDISQLPSNYNDFVSNCLIKDPKDRNPYSPGHFRSTTSTGEETVVVTKKMDKIEPLQKLAPNLQLSSRQLISTSLISAIGGGLAFVIIPFIFNLIIPYLYYSITQQRFLSAPDIFNEVFTLNLEFDSFTFFYLLFYISSFSIPLYYLSKFIYASNLTKKLLLLIVSLTALGLAWRNFRFGYVDGLSWRSIEGLIFCILVIWILKAKSNLLIKVLFTSIFMIPIIAFDLYAGYERHNWINLLLIILNALTFGLLCGYLYLNKDKTVKPSNDNLTIFQ